MHLHTETASPTTLVSRILPSFKSKDEDSCPTKNTEAHQIVEVGPNVQRQLKRIPKRLQIRQQDMEWSESSEKTLLGKGSYCEVHQVSDGRLAMKRLRLDKMAHSPVEKVRSAVMDLAREAAILSKLRHENVVEIHGVSTGTILQDGLMDMTNNNSDSSLFLLLDCLETSLDKKIKSWRQAEKDALRKHTSALRIHKRTHLRLTFLRERLYVALEIARGLQYLHSKNIVHCDLKPRNVGMDKDGVVKLIDFGLALKLVDEHDSITGSAGTPLYMAPEILRKESYGTKIDVYSFAMILWQICSLEDKPRCDVDLFDSEFCSLYLETGAIEMGSRPKTERWWPTTVKKLMMECWEDQPDNRPDFDEIVERLERIVQEEKENNGNHGFRVEPRRK